MSPSSPYIEKATVLHGRYVVRYTPAGEAFGTVVHEGWRSWSARCYACPGIIVMGSTKPMAARLLREHVEAHR